MVQANKINLSLSVQQGKYHLCRPQYNYLASALSNDANTGIAHFVNIHLGGKTLLQHDRVSSQMIRYSYGYAASLRRNARLSTKG